MELVQVYEHKKVKINDEIKDMLKISYVTYIEVNDDIATLNHPKDKRVKKLSKDMNAIKNEDYIFEIVNTKLIRCGDESLTKEELLEKAKNILLGMYYEIHSQDGIILFIQEVFDENIQEMYNRSVVPSLNKQFDALINNMGSFESIRLDANIMSQILA